MSTTQTSKTDNVLSKNILVQRTDLSVFDDSFSFLKEKFAAEMRRVDDEMTKFSLELMNLYGQTSTVGLASSKDKRTNWETITSSPLVQGEGGNKTLKLQFDVSQFDPSEVRVQINKDILLVTASHMQKTDNSDVLREFKRQFHLPKGTNPEAVISSLSRDGVLTVQAPLPQLAIEDLSSKPAGIIIEDMTSRSDNLEAQSPKKASSKTRK